MSKVIKTLEAKSIEELNIEIKKYLQLYHPCGYGTTKVGKPIIKEGIYKQIMSRWSSCD